LTRLVTALEIIAKALAQTANLSYGICANMHPTGILSLLLTILIGPSRELPEPTPSSEGTPEDRAVAYLAREVPRWSAENQCYSCHNNGDGARALYVAMRLGYELPQRVIEDTTRWLAEPEGWDHNGGEGEFSDKRLARIQFTSALAQAVLAGKVRDREVLRRAARRMAEDQVQDGTWASDASSTIGSPITYGQALATAQAVQVLRYTDPSGFQNQIDKASRWLDTAMVRNTMEAAAVLLGSPLVSATSNRQVDRAIEFLRTSQSVEGGWGPYANSPPEVFDTALVILALARCSARSELQPLVRRARTFLIEKQLEDGGWFETTRPAGAESYAQRISTSAWATMAILETRRR